MYPEIFGFIKSYGFMLALSFAIGLWLSIRRGRAHQVSSEHITDMVFGMLVAGIVGVRFFYVMTHLGDFHPWYRAFFIWDGGLTLYGGIIASTTVVYVLARRRGIPFLVMADIFSPGVLLGVGRGFGETMAVLMATGHAINIPDSIFDSVRALTATIAAELGETAVGSPHYQALFTIGIFLFAITFIINLTADLIVRGIRNS
jgi:prolipoprotein diacylglyceryltransferase